MQPLTENSVCAALHISSEQIRVYSSSIEEVGQTRIMMCKIKDERKIIAESEGELFSELEGAIISDCVRICPLSHHNRLVLNKFLPYTCPSAFGTQTCTFGMGDRLGIATPAHIRSIKSSHAKPILAQQSKRELELTGRNYTNVLDDACFAVFQEGYRGGFGADGDHLKHYSDIQDALANGFTMITLDCSEKMGKDAEHISKEELLAQYNRLPAEYRERIEGAYLKKPFCIAEKEYFFTNVELAKCALIYRGVIDFAGEIYRGLLLNATQAIDFELSIDETESVTTVHAHIFTAMELNHQNIRITSLAPKFIGDFQKGIDYIGNIDEFETQLSQHAAIATHFGYKLSIHSGSDKFDVFPVIGKYTAGNLHLKTSGTSWLEAVGTIAGCNPDLYRRIHKKALKHFDEAKKIYYVTADVGKIAALERVFDGELVKYLDDDNSRQLLHITYGFILKDDDLRTEIYNTLNLNEDHYIERLVSHMNRHLVQLGLKSKGEE